MVKNASNSAGYVLAKSIQFNTISMTHSDLMALLETNAACYEIDASKLNSIDLAGMQLLTSFSREVKRKQADIVWKNTPEIFRRTAGLLNLELTIGL